MTPQQSPSAPSSPNEHACVRSYFDEPSNAWRCDCGKYLGRDVKPSSPSPDRAEASSELVERGETKIEEVPAHIQVQAGSELDRLIDIVRFPHGHPPGFLHSRHDANGLIWRWALKWFRPASEVTAKDAQLTAQQQQIEALQGALAAQDERETQAGEVCGVSRLEHGCDWPDAVAEKVMAQQQRIEALERALAEKAMEHAVAMQELRLQRVSRAGKDAD